MCVAGEWTAKSPVKLLPFRADREKEVDFLEKCLQRAETRHVGKKHKNSLLGDVDQAHELVDTKQCVGTKRCVDSQSQQKPTGQQMSSRARAHEATNAMMYRVRHDAGLYPDLDDAWDCLGGNHVKNDRVEKKRVGGDFVVGNQVGDEKERGPRLPAIGECFSYVRYLTFAQPRHPLYVLVFLAPRDDLIDRAREIAKLVPVPSARHYVCLHIGTESAEAKAGLSTLKANFPPPVCHSLHLKPQRECTHTCINTQPAQFSHTDVYTKYRRRIECECFEGIRSASMCGFLECCCGDFEPVVGFAVSDIASWLPEPNQDVFRDPRVH